LAILTALTLRTVFRLAFRQTEGLIGSMIDLLGLSLRVPDHTTLSRRRAAEHAAAAVCKRRSKNPSLKRPGGPAAPE
jgi:hypothetical protein